MVATKLNEVAGKGWGWYSYGSPGSPARSGSGGSADATSAQGSSSSLSLSSSLSSSSAAAAAIAATSSSTSAIPAGASSSSSYYQYASDTAESAYAYLSSFLPSYRQTGTAKPNIPPHPAVESDQQSQSSNSQRGGGGGMARRASQLLQQDPSTLILSPTLYKMIHNPYISVRGGRQNRAKQPKSMEAVRNLIYVTDQQRHQDDTIGNSTVNDNNEGQVFWRRGRTSSAADARSPVIWENEALVGDDQSDGDGGFDGDSSIPAKMTPKKSFFPSNETKSSDPTTESLPMTFANSYSYSQPPATSPTSSPEETASQLAEGTLRAFRDLALDEAVELHSSLQYWTERWERPLLSWVEAGPWVWFGSSRSNHHHQSSGSQEGREAPSFGDGYDHQHIGQKVSQIQAVLARRLSTIGELQQHLLRSGWQRGVAQWGFLGEGGEWAQVPAADGRMTSTTSFPSKEDPDQSQRERKDSTKGSDHLKADDDGIPAHSRHPSLGDPTLYEPYRLRRLTSELNVIVHHTPVQHDLPTPAPTSSISQLPERSRQQLNQLYYTNLLVKKKDGGQILRDDEALAEWSVDAIGLIRSQLYRAANGQVVLPYKENWYPLEYGGDGAKDTADTFGGTADVSESADTLGPPEPVTTTGTANAIRLPAWASLRNTLCNVESDAGNTSAGSYKEDEEGEGMPIDDVHEEEENRVQEPPRLRNLDAIAKPQSSPRVYISDLPLMVDEVSGLLDCMEGVIAIQRARRLDRLKPPSWFRQNWFVAALTVPSVTYLWFRMVSEGYGWSTLKFASRQILYLVREHVVEPCRAMYTELTKGSENISDRAARDTAIETLKKMIRSWLDEAYPNMPESDRASMAEAMDISLLEATKESSMKSIYELNNVIRMSFIEAQFIKKEMMNALVALDEMQASTNFNLNLAAVTPFILLVWGIKRVSQFIFYGTLKWGKSREETYTSFLHTMTEIERLVIHRSTSDGSDTFLDSDDLGMLMLHLHELRTLLWKERRRFTTSIIRSVNEDLAELSGERGVVSVRQQLLIVERMARTYGFLRLASATNYGH